MREKFKAQYLTLINSFTAALEGRNLSGIPAVHLPIIGGLYEKTRIKIAFFGKETYGWIPMTQFMERYKQSPENGYACLTAIDPARYLEWRNNAKTSFWDYVIRFLQTLYGLDDTAFDGPEGIEVMSSFIWGNTNALEGFEVSAQGNGAKYEDWQAVKNASRVFDTARCVLDICGPDILIILNWAENESWLSGDAKINAEEIGDHHCYYPMPHTHVYWAAHPRWLNTNFGFAESAALIMADLQKRGVSATGGIFKP
jgi:hypothetical protein